MSCLDALATSTVPIFSKLLLGLCDIPTPQLTGSPILSLGALLFPVELHQVPKAQSLLPKTLHIFALICYEMQLKSTS